jgi:ankyrin repeat protein
MKTLLFAALVALASSASASDTNTIDNRDADGNTALMHAAAYGDIEMTRQLVEAGVNIKARGYIGNTALIYAAQEGYVEIVEILVEAGANPDAANDFGSTARKLAAGYGQREIVEIFETIEVQGEQNGVLAAAF